MSSIDLSNVIDYYQLLSEKIVVVLQVNHRHNVVCMVLLSHSIIVTCNRFTILNKILIRNKNNNAGTFGLFIDLQLQHSYNTGRRRGNKYSFGLLTVIDNYRLLIVIDFCQLIIFFSVSSIVINPRYQSIAIGDWYRLISSVSIDFWSRFLSIDYTWITTFLFLSLGILFPWTWWGNWNRSRP